MTLDIKFGILESMDGPLAPIQLRLSKLPLATIIVILMELAQVMEAAVAILNGLVTAVNTK